MGETAVQSKREPEAQDTQRAFRSAHPNWVTGLAPAKPASARIPATLALTAAAVAALVLVGWTFGIEPLKRLAPGLTSMNPLTAITFLAAGAATVLLIRQPVRYPRTALALGMLVMAVGLLKLVDMAFGTSLCPDRVLFHSQLDIGQSIPSRIAPNTAVCFLLLGLGIVGTDRKDWWRWLHPQLLVVPILCLALAAIVGYVYDTSGFYKLRHYIPMALHTAFDFALLGVALTMLRPYEGVLRWIPPGSLGARSYLRWLPACILIPLLLGALQLGGAHAGWFGEEVGASITAVVLALSMSLLAFLDAVSLNRMDRKRRRADTELRARLEDDRLALDRAQALSDLEDRIRVARGRMAQAAPDILGMIVKRVGGLQAILFRAVQTNDGENRLDVLAAYAYDGPQQLKVRHLFGQGLAGQCALDRQPRTLEPVPPDYFRIRSGGMEAIPRRIEFVPVVVDDECVGVLELACLDALGVDAERYLRAALRPLAFALYRDLDRTSFTRIGTTTR